MGIAGNEYEFSKTYKKTYQWPDLKLLKSGPKLKLDTILDLPFEISEEHAAMLMWQNGG